MEVSILVLLERGLANWEHAFRIPVSVAVVAAWKPKPLGSIS